MAQIVINEISQNYTYNIGTSSFATVALPITASWGPAFVDPESSGKSLDTILEETVWQRYSARQSGLEAFVSTYRGPAANYRVARDYSYQIAMTLLTAGYDVLVCRLCPGTTASGKFTVADQQTFNLTAKYPGSFGNNLQVSLNKVPNRNYWNLVVYVIDNSNVRTAVENLLFCFELEHSADNIPHISEVESAFLTFSTTGNITEASEFKTNVIQLAGGDDRAAANDDANKAAELATTRYTDAGIITDDNPADNIDYIKALKSLAGVDAARARTLRYNEWLYTYAFKVYDLLKDKLSYNPQRIISPGWDDQDTISLTGEIGNNMVVSPLHVKLMDVAYYSRCATALIDIPRSLPRSKVHDESPQDASAGYAQKLARYQPANAALDINTALYPTHSALFAPWGQYTYVGTNKQSPASPSFLSLMIQRAMILNQSLQYEWALPTNRRHNLKIGKLDYTVNKKLLDKWQKLDGVGVNVITTIPDMGTTLWGNSTLYEVPPATYQALANLSTRYLVNAVKDVCYRCGISITFQYNNEQAYSAFYAGVTPILDTMKNVGAVDDYYIRIADDLNSLDQVHANTLVGKVYLVINGVVNDIYIDLIALPPGSDLDQYKA